MSLQWWGWSCWWWWRWWSDIEEVLIDDVPTPPTLIAGSWYNGGQNPCLSSCDEDQVMILMLMLMVVLLSVVMVMMDKAYKALSIRLSAWPNSQTHGGKWTNGQSGWASEVWQCRYCQCPPLLERLWMTLTCLQWICDMRIVALASVWKGVLHNLRSCRWGSHISASVRWLVGQGVKGKEWESNPFWRSYSDWVTHCTGQEREIFFWQKERQDWKKIFSFPPWEWRRHTSC